MPALGVIDPKGEKMSFKLYVPKGNSENPVIIDVDLEKGDYVSTIELQSKVSPSIFHQLGIGKQNLVDSHYVLLLCCGTKNREVVYRIATPEEERILAIQKHGYQSELRSGPRPVS